MIFLFKKKKIVLDAFTSISSFLDLSPIEKASNFFPQWWRNLDNQYEQYVPRNDMTIPTSTMKRCSGVIDLYRKGFIMPLWSDVKIETSSNGNLKYKFAAPIHDSISSHPKEQYGQAFDDFIHVKLTSPWKLREKSGIEFYFAPAYWNQFDYNNFINVIPGVMNFKYQCNSSVHFFLPKKDASFILPFRYPLQHIMPLTDADVDVKCHLVSNEELHKIIDTRSFAASFTGSYKKINRILDDNELKCPFGFKK